MNQAISRCCTFLVSALVTTVIALPAFADEAKKTIKSEEGVDTSAARDRSRADELAEEEANKARDKLEQLVPTIVEEDKEVGKVETASGPNLEYEQFRRAIQVKVKAKRDDLVKQLDTILDTVEDDDPERPALLFQKAELFLEDSQFYFLEGMSLDDKIADALDAGNDEVVLDSQDKKEALLDNSRDRVRDAVLIFQEIESTYPDFERMPEVLYSLGRAFWDVNSYKKALAVYRKLIGRFPKSKFVSDAYLAFGEYYFQMADENDRDLNKALDAYKRAAADQDSEVFGYATYKQGWCYYNLNKHDRAADKFKEVVLYSQINEDMLGKKRKAALAREARRDFVLAYAQYGSGRKAPTEFRTVSEGEEHQKMLQRLADIYYTNGKDRDAIFVYQQLMKMDPSSSKNPLFQGKIVKLASRIGQQKHVVREAKKLVTEFQKVEKQVNGLPASDPKRAMMQNDLSQAEEVSDNTLRYLATTWHNDARKLKNDELYGFAYELYGDYIKLFPKKKETYEIRFFYAQLLYKLEKFEDSGAQYLNVYELQPKGKLAYDAAESAVYAYDEVVKDYNRANKNQKIALGEKQAIPDIKQKLISACDIYSQNYPEGRIAVQAAYKVARTQYEYNHFDDSTPGFLNIIKLYPKHARAEQSATLVLDTYEIQKNYKEMNKFAREFKKNRALMKNKEFAELVAKVLEESSFKLINEYEKEEKDWKGTAQKYLRFADEFRKSELRDKSLANAAAMFTRAGELDEAIKVRKRLVREHPKSPLVAEQIYNIASAYEQVVAYDDAADWLEKFVDQNPKDERAKDALFNASIYRQGVGQTKKAVEDREKYLKTYPNAKDLADIAFSIPVAWEQANRRKDAVEAYLAFAKKWRKKSPEKAFFAQYKAVRKLEAMGKRKKRDYEKELSVLRRMSRGLKKSDSVETGDPLAYLKFIASDATMTKYKKQKIAKPDNPSAFQRTLKTKNASKKKVVDAYTDVVKYKSPEWAVAALYQIGKTNDHLVRALRAVPAPRGLTSEQSMLFRDKLEEQTYPLEEQAAQSMVLCLDKSAEFGVFNKWTRRCLSYLEERRPTEFPKATLEKQTPLQLANTREERGLGLLLDLPKDGESMAPVAGTEPPTPPSKSSVTMSKAPPKEDDFNFEDE